MDYGSDSRSRLLLLCGCVLFVVGVAGFGFDRVLVREGVPRTDILIVSNTLTGIVAAVFFYYLSNHERENRKLVKQRLRTIADMNHHIRNALQIITYVTSSEKRENSVQLIRSSLERIEWALREVLPGYAAVPSTEPAKEEHAETTRAR